MNAIQLSKLERDLQLFLANTPVKLPEKIIRKPRACAEAFEELLKENFEDILGSRGTNYEPSTRAKSTADLSFTDTYNNYCAVDIKTHCLGKWGMPNIISYKKLAKLYDNDSNIFYVLLVEYEISHGRTNVTKCTIVPIEHLSWDCLAVQGTLGQVQIKNAERVIIQPTARPAWMAQFSKTVLSSIDTKVASLKKERVNFEALETKWKNKLEVPRDMIYNHI